MSETALSRLAPRGAYAEHDEAPPGWLDRQSARIAGPVLRRLRARPRACARLVARAAAEGRTLDGLDDAALRAVADALRPHLRRDGFREDVLARVFAVVREVARRTIGLRPFDVQLAGGWVLAHGMVAEMETGEGKTLTATLPACAAALAGVPVHVVTVNDYLATRDTEWMGPIYRFLGLSVGTIVHGMTSEARRAAYAADVTYCTNKELTFDYLRDRIVLGRRPGRLHLQLERLATSAARADRLLLRGLHFAIVDEADGVLVDEARTPLIISGGAGDAPNQPDQPLYETALRLARELAPRREFVIDELARAVELTPAGRMRLAALAPPGGPWSGRIRREELVRQALAADRLFVRDTHYLVREGRVQIVDEYTGRIMGDRSWEHGLHQLIEVKEGCELTGRHDPLTRISYQRFFRRYLRLAGMTGTAREVASELWSVYGLAVVRVPTNRPVRRRRLRDRVYDTADARWEAVVARVADLHRENRPVLVGTRSVAASEHLAGLLAAAGLPHQVLNARQDGDEAALVARAGEPGRITVATNMAGRGTDIKLAPGVAERGGLHVLATERHEARRIDRQLFGRCARQGDPGSCELLASLEDEILTVHGRLVRRLGERGGTRSAWRATLVLRLAQRSAERTHARVRRELLRADEQLASLLAFSGRGE